jgi:hypothetical protein
LSAFKGQDFSKQIAADQALLKAYESDLLDANLTNAFFMFDREEIYRGSIKTQKMEKLARIDGTRKRYERLVPNA